MLLCDLIARAAAFRDDPVRLGVPRGAAAAPIVKAQLSGASELANGMRGWPRYILADEVVAASTHVLLSRPSSIRDCLSALRVPWPVAWVEWREPARIAARQEFGISYDNGRDVPSRFGFLVTADPDGRRGSVRFCWAHEQASGWLGAMPNISPIILRYDFDRLFDSTLPTIPESAREASDIYRRWARSSSDVEALDEINRVFWLEIGKEARDNARAVAETTGRPGDIKAWIDSLLADLSGEQMSFVAAIMMLSARNGIETRAEDRTRLNKARRRRGESELLDHVVAYLRLGKGEAHAGARLGDGAPDGAGRMRRAHMVRGHFVARAGKIFWRRAHVRGLGSGLPSAATRTVHVTL